MRCVWLGALAAVIAVVAACSVTNITNVFPVDDAGAQDGSSNDGASNGAATLDGGVHDAAAHDASVDASWASDGGAGPFGDPKIACSFTVAAPHQQLIKGVAISATQRIAITGTTVAESDGGGAPFDLGDGTPIKPALGQTNMGFVAELDSNCQLLWARPEIDNCGPSAFDSAGNLWIASGHFFQTLTKLDPMGAPLYQITFGAYPSLPIVVIHGIAVDANDAVLLAGEYGGTPAPSLGGDPLPGSVGGSFVAKLDASGTHLWSKGFAGAVDCQRSTWNIALDPSGDPVIAGVFGGTTTPCDFSLGGLMLPATTLAENPGSGFSGFVGRLSGVDGSHVWSTGWKASDATAACITQSGAVFTTGLLNGTSDLGFGSVAPPDGGRASFLSMLSSDGGPAWSQLVGSTQQLVRDGVEPFHVLCGGDLGERALMSGANAFGNGSAVLQEVEGDGGTVWTKTLPHTTQFTSIAVGSHRDLAFGGALGTFVNESQDVYLVRFTR